MKTTWFIAQRLALSGQSRFTAFILRLGIAGVALSIAVMIISTAVTRGFQAEISNKVFGFWGHIHLTHFQSFRSLESRPFLMDDVDRDIFNIGPISHQHTPMLFGREVDWLSSEKSTYGGVSHIQQFAYKPGIIRTRELMEGLIMKGLGSDMNRELLSGFIVDGYIPQYSDTLTRDEILLSETTARRLAVKTGDRLRGYFVDGNDELVRGLVVAGIYKTGIEEHDSRYFIGDINLIRGINQWQQNQTGGYEIFLNDFKDLRPFYDHFYNSITEPTLYVSSIQSVFPNLFGWLSLQHVNEQVILLLMLIVAVINMCTALLILIMEHTRYIGVFKTIGMTGQGIRSIFLVYAALVVLAGQGIGNILGLTICALQEKFKFIKLPEEAYYISYAPIQIDWSLIFLLNIVAFIAIMLSLFLPLLWIQRVKIINVLRFS